MAFRLGLGLYLFFAARAAAPTPEEAPAPPARPGGPLIWLHAPEGASGPGALAELVDRMRGTRPDLNALLTVEGDPPAPPGCLVQPPPPETLPDIRAFLDRWRPDLIVLSGASLPPATIHEAYRAEIPVYLVDAMPPERGHPPRLPGVVATLLQRLTRIVAIDTASARVLRRLGAITPRLEVAGKMQEEAGVLPCVEAEREALAWLARTRPIWLAAGLPADEEAAIITAHRAALRLAHRMLLIVVPADPERGPALAERMQREQKWTVALRADDQEPDDDCQVYIADTEDEMGLWYRLAPITYMGGTLKGSGSLRSPYEPAALGSAVIHGPRSGAYAPAYARLAEARATRELRNMGELGEAVGDLLAPDKSAELARNAWEVSTAGSDVTDHVSDMLLAALEARGKAREGT